MLFRSTHYGEWPLTWDNSKRTPKTPEEALFLQEHIDKEDDLGRDSASFGPDLLPGMYSMPIHAVPKPGSKKYRLQSPSTMCRTWAMPFDIFARKTLTLT